MITDKVFLICTLSTLTLDRRRCAASVALLNTAVRTELCEPSNHCHISSSRAEHRSRICVISNPDETSDMCVRGAPDLSAIDIEVQAVSKVAIKKRKRIAGIVARLRARQNARQTRKRKRIAISKRELKEAAERVGFWKGECDLFRLPYQNSGSQNYCLRLSPSRHCRSNFEAKFKFLEQSKCSKAEMKADAS